eukprot:12887746-Prorocentrum_lima.AAC.1
MRTCKQHSALSHARISRLATRAAGTMSALTSLSHTARNDWCVYTSWPPAPESSWASTKQHRKALSAAAYV